MNALSINIPANFAADCNNTLKRYNAAQTDAERRAVLDRQTVQGLWWAIKFVSQLQTAYMSEKDRCFFSRLYGPGGGLHRGRREDV